MPRSYLFISLAILLMLSKGVSGQSPTFSTKDNLSHEWQFNYHIGFTQYYGDASNNGYFKKMSGESAFGTGIMARKFLTPTFALGAGFYYSSIKSHKQKAATGAVVDFELSGKYYDGSVHLYVDLNNLFWEEAPRKVSFYSTIGLGYSGWNNQLTDHLSGLVINSGDAVNGTATKKSGVVVPIGLGVNYLLGNNWALNFEGNLHTVLSDDVDMWADGFKYDQPFYTQIGISYYFDSKEKQKTPKTRGERPRMNNAAIQNQKNMDQIPLYDYRKQPVKPVVKKVKPTAPEVIDQAQVSPSGNLKGMVYRVQILAKNQSMRSVDGLKRQFGLSGEIFENFQDGVYRYSVGSFSNYQQALIYSQELKQRGIADAFVVVYQDNKRIKLTDNLKK